jgi:adenylate cyclase
MEDSISLILNIAHQGLAEFIKEQDFNRLLESYVHMFKSKGVSIDRLQIPMQKLVGFRHPLYAVMILTWRSTNIDVMTVSHENWDKGKETGFQAIRKTPYGPLFFELEDFIQFKLQVSRPFEILQTLYSEEDIVDYCAFLLPLPNESKQMLSIATKDINGFPANIEEIIEELKLPIALSLFAAYQSSVSMSIATTYLGKRTGLRVLNGDISRGAQTKIDAGIMFCDIRGFTAMSERLGAKGIIPMINMIFEKVGSCVSESGGEILKFIGDAMLVIFPYSSSEEETEVARIMVDAAIQAINQVEELGEQNQLELSVGFGCHIGEVLYGNIGASERLDFTVMGPAVNLASRLESMCKPLEAKLTASKKVYRDNPKLSYLGEHSMKGITEKVPVWGVCIVD